MELEALRLLWLPAALCAPVIAAIWGLKRPPRWLVEGPLVSAWLRIAAWGLVAAGATAGALSGVYWSAPPLLQGLAVVGGAGVAYVLTQSLFTDVRQRRVWRWSLNIPTLAAIAVGLPLMLLERSEVDVLVYFVFLAAATAVVLFNGKAMGDSDGRALQLSVAVLMPLGGWLALQYALVGFLALLLLYGGAQAFRARSWRFLISTKTSIPMVPLFLAPVWSLLFLMPWL
jgi:hypothetical protein